MQAACKERTGVEDSYVPEQHAGCARGLEDVEVERSEICSIDGEKGKLYYRGYSIEDLVQYSTYEEVAYLLTMGRLPAADELDMFSATMRSSRPVPLEVRRMIKSFPRSGTPMEMLQSAVLYLKGYAGHRCWHTKTCSVMNGLHQVAQLPTVIAAYHRMREGMHYIRPRPDLSHGSNFLYMLTGQEPDPRDGEILDKCFVLHAEHGFNAGTFAARVVASTDSTCYCGVSAAIGALQGHLHGGANERVFDRITAIGTKKNVSAWLDQVIRGRGKVPGMGHRVYKVKDPRAVILEEYLEEVSARRQDWRLLELLRELETQFVQRMEASGKKIYSNVDYYSGALYYLLGVPGKLFSPLFAAARSSGWLAHIREQRSNNRLIRPRCRYTGPQARSYKRIEERSTSLEVNPDIK